jgi:type VI protein secretion system component VasK
MSSIYGVSSIGTLYPANDSSQASSAQSNFNLFEQLASSLQSGNLSGAQQAYTSLAASFQNSPSAQTTNPLSADFQALGQALQSGNLSAAQQAFSTLQQAFQQIGGAGGHHHHHGGGGGGSASLLQALTSTTNSPSDSILTIASPGATTTNGTTSSANLSESSLLNLIA